MHNGALLTIVPRDLSPVTAIVECLAKRRPGPGLAPPDASCTFDQGASGRRLWEQQMWTEMSGTRSIVLRIRPEQGPQGAELNTP